MPKIFRRAAEIFGPWQWQNRFVPRILAREYSAHVIETTSSGMGYLRFLLSAKDFTVPLSATFDGSRPERRDMARSSGDLAYIELAKALCRVVQPKHSQRALYRDQIRSLCVLETPITKLSGTDNLYSCSDLSCSPTWLPAPGSTCVVNCYPGLSSGGKPTAMRVDRTSEGAARAVPSKAAVA